MKNSVFAIQSFFVITTTIVYALLVPLFLVMNNAHGEGENFVDKTIYSQQIILAEFECKSPCPESEKCA